MLAKKPAKGGSCWNQQLKAASTEECQKHEVAPIDDLLVLITETYIG